uniref:Uncharacterized protein n=1 Tax=Chrysotila carterae TaxID=13221 RepID=A0A7S4BNH3_CHRCT
MQDFCVARVGEQATKFFGSECNGKHALEAPASVQAVINELHSLEQAHKKVSKHSKKIMIPGAIFVVLFLFFACVPLLWDKTSYLIAVSSIIIPKAMNEAAFNYIRSNK